MARAAKPLLVPIPLHNRGGLMHDTDYARGAESIEHAAYIDAECLAKSGHMRWGANYYMGTVEPFAAYLRIVRHFKGHSSAYVELADPEGRTWPMFLSDFVELLASTSVTDGLIDEHLYEVCKKGQAYGIRPVKN